MKLARPLLISFLFLSLHAKAEVTLRQLGPSDCDDMTVWDYSMSMCMPRAMPDMSMTMVMLNTNGFLVQTFQEGPRGRKALSGPNKVMADIGTTVGSRNYINLDVMATVERWTFPAAGYPELLQIGEENQDHQKYIDAQHPHSSPLMGLTLSDTVSMGAGKDYLKFWFAPRGQSTEGPIAFMHRATGLMNPDAPLGHHIGQDVGHISSTVLAASASFSGTMLELSTFNGTEPEPANVDLPIATPNSYAARLIRQFNSETYAMMSAAFVKNPEPHEPSLDHIWRYSASVYRDRALKDGWRLHSSFVYGLVNFYDKTGALNSFLNEFWLHKDSNHIWGRIEVLERTSSELNIVSPAPDEAKWVGALTIGYTRELLRGDLGALGLGASATRDFLPSEFQNSYGGEPLTAKIFLQAGGLKMWDL